MLDGLVLAWQPSVRRGVIGVDGSLRLRVPGNELMQGLGVHEWHHMGTGLVAGPILDAGNCGLAHGAPSGAGQFLALRVGQAA